MVEVPVRTLDDLVAEFGLPRFCKIDVEGMEAEILAGLSQPIPLLAFEYLPAARALADACLVRLEALGPYRFNRVVGEAHRFASPGWIDAAGMRAVLAAMPTDAGSGDVYASLHV